jgi:hypothetical protein
VLLAFGLLLILFARFRRRFYMRAAAPATDLDARRAE